MANLIDRLRGASDTEQRFSFSDYANWVAVNGAGGGMAYPSGSMTGSPTEDIAANFAGLVGSVHQRHGIVPACVFARQLVLSQLRFVFRGTIRGQNKGKIVGGTGLAPLERPGPNMTRPTLLKKAESHISYAGNAFFHFGRHLSLLRPDWVTMMLESELEPDHPGWAEDATIRAIAYTPGGPMSGKSARIMLPGEFVHWAPEPDPSAQFRGESWVQSVLKEITTDKQATDHTSKFFEHGATPNMIVSTDSNLTPEQAEHLYSSINRSHAGSENAYKTLLLTSGADAKVVGSSLSDLSLKDTTGGFEARIASRSRVPSVILGTREGTQGSALNAGNYAQTRRLWADGWFTPTVQDLCAALDPAIGKPGRNESDVELWYDPADVMFLQEDQKDLADIQAQQAATIRQYVDGGFEPATAVDAVQNDDLSMLKHTGKMSVQLQEPGISESPQRSEPEPIADPRPELSSRVREVERDDHGNIVRIYDRTAS